jgi:hypothetical protein
MKLQTTLIEDGFVVIPDVLSQAEIAQLRQQVQSILDEQGLPKSGGTVLPNAAAEAPSLSWIFAHARIIESVRAATALRELVFTAEADLHRNFVSGNWHKDTGEMMMEGGYFGCDAMSSEDCRVYKVAIYLQDHLDTSGLTVRIGSTSNPDLSEGQERHLATRAGDIVLFDVRLTHRGICPTLFDRVTTRLGDISPVDSSTLAATIRLWKYRAQRRPDRLAVYFALGAPNERSEIFAARNMRRQLQQLGRQKFAISSDLRGRFTDQNIRTASID